MAKNASPAITPEVKTKYLILDLSLDWQTADRQEGSSFYGCLEPEFSVNYFVEGVVDGDEGVSLPVIPREVTPPWLQAVINSV